VEIVTYKWSGTDRWLSAILDLDNFFYPDIHNTDVFGRRCYSDGGLGLKASDSKGETGVGWM